MDWSGKGNGVVGVLLGPVATVLAALVAVYPGAAVTRRSEARRADSLTVVEVCWAMLDVRAVFDDRLDFGAQMSAKGRLGQTLRRFVSFRLGAVEHKKAVEVSKLLFWLAAGTWEPHPEFRQDFVAGPLGRLVDAYPELLSDLEPDEESRKEFLSMVRGVPKGASQGGCAFMVVALV